MTNFTTGNMLNTITNMTTLADPFILINTITGGYFGVMICASVFFLIFILSENKLDGFIISSFVSFFVSWALAGAGILNINWLPFVFGALGIIGLANRI